MYNEIIILVGIVVAFASIYAFGWVCWNQGHYAGFNEGIEAGRLEILNENLIRADRAYWLNNLKDDACIKLFDACMPIPTEKRSAYEKLCCMRYEDR